MNKWTKENLITFAKRFETKKCFKDNAGGAYNAARRLGVMDAACAHMKDGRAPYLWTKRKLIYEAKKYKTKMEFKRGSSGAYQAAIRQGVYNDVTKHMCTAVLDQVVINREAKEVDDVKSIYNGRGTDSLWIAERNRSDEKLQEDNFIYNAF